MPSSEIQQFANIIPLSGLRNDDGRIGMPIHEIISTCYTGHQRFLSSEAFEYLALLGYIRKSFRSRVGFLTGEGKEAAEAVRKEIDGS